MQWRFNDSGIAEVFSYRQDRQSAPAPGQDPKKAEARHLQYPAQKGPWWVRGCAYLEAETSLVITSLTCEDANF